MKPGITFTQDVNQEYMRALTLLVVRTMNEEVQKKAAKKRREAWKKGVLKA